MNDAGLAALMAEAEAADGQTRIRYRDPIAGHGATALSEMERWLRRPGLAAFSVQVIRAIGEDPALRRRARSALEAARLDVDAPIQRDIEYALERMGPARTTTISRSAKPEPLWPQSAKSTARPPMRDVPVRTTRSEVGDSTVLVKWFEADAPGLRATLGKHAESPESLAWFVLATQARDLRRIGRIDRLIGIESLRGSITPHAFQMKAALDVLQDPNRAKLMADEVGLGKTIEAGLVIKELLLRGEIKSVLIVVPRALVAQWQTELRDKFGEEFETTDEDGAAHRSKDRVITTLGKFQRASAEFAERDWDLVLFDEAHLLANPKSKRRAAAGSVRRRWLLLLTATPLSNKITDLWSLVDLVSPGRLGSQGQFISSYAADKTLRTVVASRTDELRNVARQVMTRTRRAESGVPFTSRHVQTRKVTATKDENQLYDAVTDYLHRVYRPQLDDGSAGNRGMLIREAITLQQSLSSGPQALARSLESRAGKNPTDAAALNALAEHARSIRGSKEKLLLRVVKEAENEPAVIFTLRHETLERLVVLLEGEGHEVRPYHGAMGRGARQEAVESFTKGSARFLIATDAGAEGLNLHRRCNVVFNYDLHWNPMKLEQRIGRVHRFGQERDVTVFNLAVSDTVDDYVLEVLTQKLNLFTSVIGEVEDVLAEIAEGEGDLEAMIMELVLRSKDRADLKRRMKDLETDVGEAYKRSQLAKEFTAGVLG